jgi:NAD(P)-dependent dehydrogenase (short-subunit alcohol dehydrogenase family)
LATADSIAVPAQHRTDREARVDVLTRQRCRELGRTSGEFPKSAIDRVRDLNVKGVLLLTQALVPLLRVASTRDDPGRRGTGAIIPLDGCLTVAR